MGNPIKSNQVVQDELFDNLKASAKRANEQINQLRNTLSKTADNAKKLSKEGLKFDTTGIAKLEKEVAKLKVTLKDKNNLDKEQIQLNRDNQKAEQELIKTKIARNRLAEQEKRIKDKGIAQSKREKKVQEDLNNEYTKQSRILNDLRKRYKHFAAANKESSEDAKGLLRQITRLDSKLKKVDKTVGQSQRHVGDYGRGTNRLTGGLLKATAGFGAMLFSVQAFTRAMTESFRILSTFELELTKLGVISGASALELEGLEESAKNLGRTTQFTAVQVLELQTSFAKLGFTAKEIEGATKATLDLSIVTGTDLASAAEVAGTTLRAFGLNARETSRVTDVMTKSFNSSALDIEKFRESMKLVAPIAKAANIPIETTTALLGQLADAGLSGSIAGTSLKNLLSKLTNPTSALSKELGFAVKNSEDLFKAFNKLKDSNIDLAAATELTDERSKAAFLTLLNGVDSVKALNIELDNAAGSASLAAEKIGNTLSGKVKGFTSAIQGLILEGTSLNGFFKDVISGATAMINALAGVSEQSEKTRHELIDDNIKLLKSTDLLVDESKDLVKEYKNLSNQTHLSAESKDRLERITSDLITRFGQSVVEINKETGAIRLNIEAVEAKIAMEIALQSETTRSLIADKIKIKNQLRLAKEYREGLVKELDFSKNSAFGSSAGPVIPIEFISPEERTIIQLAQESADLIVRELKDNMSAGIDIREVIDFDGVNDDIQDLSDKISDAIHNVRGADLADSFDFVDIVDNTENALSVLLPFLKAQNDALVNEAANKRTLIRLNQALIESGIDLTKDIKESTNAKGKGNNEDERSLGILEKLRKKMADLVKSREQAFSADAISEYNTQISETRKEIEKLLETINKDKEAGDVIGIQLTKDIISEQERRNGLVEDLSKNRELSAEKRTDALEEIEKDYQENVLDLEIEALEDRLAVQNNSDEEELQLQLELNDKKLENEKQFNQALADLKAEEDEKAAEKAKEEAEKRIQINEQANALLLQFFQKRSEEDLAKIDRKLDAIQSRGDELEQAAAAGDAQAVETLAFERKREVELQKEREKEVKKQKQREAGLAALRLVSSKAAAGDENPVQSSLQDSAGIAGITSLILASLYDGTEDTGTVAKPLDSKGGRYAILHDKERVMTAKQNKKVGGLTNPELANVAEMYNEGVLTPMDFNNDAYKVVARPYESNTELLNRVDKLDQTMKDGFRNMPKYSAHYDVMNKAITEKWESRGKIERKHTKTGGVWGA